MTLAHIFPDSLPSCLGQALHYRERPPVEVAGVSVTYAAQVTIQVDIWAVLKVFRASDR
jgi:hypothetical protein